MNEEIIRLIKESNWSIKCPSKDNENMTLTFEQDYFLATSNSLSDFSIKLPYQWYKISATATIRYLLHKVPGIIAQDARQWVNNVKYTHPSYWETQRKERILAKEPFQQVIRFVAQEKDTPYHLMSVGCNNCIEFEDFPFDWSEKDSLGVDVSALALTHAKANYPQMSFCCDFVENISRESTSTDGEKVDKQFDICLAMRVLQGSGLELWASLTKIRDLLKPNGWLIISIPRQTVLQLGNLYPGIYKSQGDFDIDSPKDVVELIAKNLSAKESRMYKNTTVFYGDKNDVEYYIATQKNL